MKLHEAQREAFEAHAAKTFPERLRAFLSDNLPERRSELEGMAGLRRVSIVIDGARDRGFSGERDVVKFVSLSYLLGEDFHAEPWASAVLEDPGIETPTLRVDALWAAAERRELDEAQADLTRALR